jgi:Flp pilus assembly protein TadD
MTNMAVSTPRIFVSHSHFDDGFCRTFVARMRAMLGVADRSLIFYDADSLYAGDEFLSRIQDEIVSRPVFIVILTPQSVVANYVKHETNLALRLYIEQSGRYILPVLASDCDPNTLAPSLLSYQMVDFAHGDYEQALDRLVTALRSFGGAADTFSGLSTFQPSPQVVHALQLATQTHDAIAAGNWDEAVLQGEFAKSFPENQSNADLWADLAYAYMQRERWQLASDAARHTLELDPFRGDVWSCLANSLVILGDIQGALLAIDRARAITLPAQVELRQALLGQRRTLLVRLQRWSDALDNIRLELSINADNAVAIATRDQILLRLWQAGEVSYQPVQPALSLRHMPSISAAAQWPTLQIGDSSGSSHAHGADHKSAAFGMQHRISQAIKRFATNLRDDQ